MRYLFITLLAALTACLAGCNPMPKPGEVEMTVRQGGQTKVVTTSVPISTLNNYSIKHD